MWFETDRLEMCGAQLGLMYNDGDHKQVKAHACKASLVFSFNHNYD